MNEYIRCRLCPRECGVNRAAGHRGYCGETSQLRAGLAYLHQWEEPCISGTRGSGTIFFSGCSLGCVFCQNRVLSRSERGIFMDTSRLVETFWRLREQGAHNINLVTATHFLPQIVEALETAKKEGFDKPFVLNSGGYEKVDSLKRLDGLIDVYLPDFKFWEAATAQRYARAADYPEQAKQTIEEMVRQTGAILEDGHGLLLRGTIVRHLVLPHHVREAKRIILYLHERYGETIRMSIMSQYTPMAGLEDWPELTRRLRRKEYNRVLDFLLEHDIMNCYVQEGQTAEESFIPNFDGRGLD